MVKARAAQKTAKEKTVKGTERLAFQHLITLMTDAMNMEDFSSALIVITSATQQYDKAAVATINHGGDKELQRETAAIAAIYHLDMLRGELLKDGNKHTQQR